jgi:hypothetical protein
LNIERRNLPLRDGSSNNINILQKWIDCIPVLVKADNAEGAGGVMISLEQEERAERVLDFLCQQE